MSKSVPSSGNAPVREPRQATKRPPIYKVLLHNDHYTSMEFVVEILLSVFRRPASESVEIMLKIHNDGVGIAGVYPADIAETKIDSVHTLAKEHGFPLACTMEPE